MSLGSLSQCAREFLMVECKMYKFRQCVAPCVCCSLVRIAQFKEESRCHYMSVVRCWYHDIKVDRDVMNSTQNTLLEGAILWIQRSAFQTFEAENRIRGRRKNITELGSSRDLLTL